MALMGRDGVHWHPRVSTGHPRVFVCGETDDHHRDRKFGWAWDGVPNVKTCPACLYAYQCLGQPRG